MDDIILISKKEGWDKDKFIKDFSSECYWKPLKLEKTNDGIFLENKFEIKENQLKFRLKNKNEDSIEVWRYHHYLSKMSYTTKRSSLLATLRKLHKMASDDDELMTSALHKLEEFRLLQYPLGIRKYMCAIMARDTSNTVWRIVRNKLTS